ncbi:hypothetical protein VRC03_17805 [Erwinia aphidicola]|uniref:hypothetical protein n=1 Tax=Erwinia aphidicola TaxID=68334 RepID=UPI0030CEB4AE
MELQPYPESHFIQVKLDWVELSCLANPFFTFRVAELRNAIENLEGFTTGDIAEEDAKVENEIQKILEQYVKRTRILGDTYPFIYNAEDQYFELRCGSLEELEIYHHSYIYCLYFSHITKSRLFSGIVQTTNAHRDLLQIAATVALAGYARGSSISFGWPRPDSSRFYDALCRVIGLINEGRVKPFEHVNRFLQSRPFKDAGVDVVAWREDNPHDIDPGNKHIFFAQVASGHDWRGKPVKEDIRVIQEYWLEQRLFRVTDAIVIPFDFEQDDEGIKRDEISLIANEFGVVIHRMRLPQYFKAGLTLLAESPELLVERSDEIQGIGEYVFQITQALQGEAA